jgi:predicted amino acid racemase
MAQLSPIGQPREALDTPALLVDLDVLQSNIARMARTIVQEAGVGWRPHIKGIKTPAIAHLLLRAGALGLTCAKLGEAEVMAAAGIRDLLIANQIVGAQKIARLVNLCRHAEVVVAVDSLENAEELGQAATAKGVELRVVIEVDTGMQRAGVAPGEAAVALARQLAALQGLRFAGLMTWESPALRIKDHKERQQLIAGLLGQLTTTAQACRDAGLPVEIVSCGGSGTYWLSAFEPGITEVQAGGGVFNDVVYCRQLGLDHPFASRPYPDHLRCGQEDHERSGGPARAPGSAPGAVPGALGRARQDRAGRPQRHPAPGGEDRIHPRLRGHHRGPARRVVRDKEGNRRDSLAPAGAGPAAVAQAPATSMATLAHWKSRSGS